jgi:hypothetical protein
MKTQSERGNIIFACENSSDLFKHTEDKIFPSGLSTASVTSAV